MGRIKNFFQNLSLRKSIVCYIVFFALLAGFLGNITAGACYRISNRIQEKYTKETEKYYLTNEAGERLGEGTYIYKTPLPFTEEDQRLLELLDVFLTVAAPLYAVLAVAAAAFLFYRQKLKRPLELLTAASDKISRSELDFTLDYDRKDEMGRLCRSFEIMRSALEENQTKMWRRMEERKSLNAAFAHDLRTPLTVLKGCNEMLQLTGGERERAAADMMEKHILRLEHYAESMSSIRRLEDREPEYGRLRMEEYLSVLERGADVFCGKAGKKLCFRVQITSDWLLLDQEFLQQVFDNLLSNAVRYAKACVYVTVRERPEELELTVEDDGEGFSAEALERGMRPYYSGAGGEEHFGLGLYICKLLCAGHGGYLQLENTERGGKVIAVFRFPAGALTI